MDNKRTYASPRLVRLGTVADLTKAGNTNPTNADVKGGSVDAPGLRPNNLGL